MTRRVVLICGPAGAGKSTRARRLAQAEALDVYDLDDEIWHGSHGRFQTAIGKLADQPDARAVVIRTAPTLTGRRQAAALIGATETVVLTVPLPECIRRIQDRGREHPPIPAQIKAARTWWDQYEPEEPGPSTPASPTARAPRCGRCDRRHLPNLPCWSGRYAERIRTAILATKGRVCWICGGPADAVDHDQPRSKGGTDHPDNLLPACSPCNSTRGDRDPFTPDPDPQPTGVGLSPRWRTTT